MLIKKDKFEELINGDFDGNRSKAALSLQVTPQYIHKFLNQLDAKAGADLLGGLAAYCLRKQLNFWDFIILPSRSTKV